MTDSTVAFSAVTETRQSVAVGETLTFDHEFTNEGGAYDNEQGVFTCPSTGYYQFSIALHRPAAIGTTWNINANLVRGDTTIITLSTYTFGQAENHRDTVSNTIIIPCSEGETVELKAASDFDFYEDRRSSFSGMLLCTDCN